MKYVSLLFVSLFLYSAVDAELSPVTEKTVPKFEKIDQEIGSFGSKASELILHISYLQDTLLAYLHDAESKDEYLAGMKLFQENTDSLVSVSTYITSVFNFYTGQYELSRPQEVDLVYDGKKVNGFLNTFKIAKDLTAEERVNFFEQEATHYAKDAIEFPFLLDSSALDQLKPETIYNFALLPDGTIYAALERPGDREYQVRDEVLLEAFRYPNHTILAGSPHQIVLSAGALIFYQIDDKKLFFISCKSGHFQPTYRSLEFMKSRLIQLGVEAATIVPLPDLDMSQCIIKTYTGAKVPVLLTQKDADTLFTNANERWQKFYNEIDQTTLLELSQGNTALLSDELVATIKKQRAEATYMRSAYHLFTHDSQIPANFKELVKRFGKLKDAIKHFRLNKFNIERMKSEATTVLSLIQKCKEEQEGYEFYPADDATLSFVISENFAHIQNLLSQESLTKDEYHDLKKLSRETGALFMYIASDLQYKGRGFFISHTALLGFFQINDLMASTDYTYAETTPGGEVRVKVPRKIANLLTKYISHIAIAPSTFTFELDPKEAFWMINYAKDLYHLSKRMEEIFAAAPLAVENLSQKLSYLKRLLERAGNALMFLDQSHKAPEAYHTFSEAIDRMINYLKNNDTASLYSEGADFRHLCYHVPGMGLQNWQISDQKSFDTTLQQTLSPLFDLQNSSVQEIRTKVQAFRDLINLKRRHGLSKINELMPMVVFDALEAHADIILEELMLHGSITQKLQDSALFITKRVRPFRAL